MRFMLDCRIKRRGTVQRRERRVAVTAAGEEKLAGCRQQVVYLMRLMLEIFPPAKPNKILSALQALDEGVHEKWLGDFGDDKSVGGKALLPPGGSR
jgi:DNA-binding MarR family transcriptional regulator